MKTVMVNGCNITQTRYLVLLCCAVEAREQLHISRVTGAYGPNIARLVMAGFLEQSFHRAIPLYKTTPAGAEAIRKYKEANP